MDTPPTHPPIAQPAAATVQPPGLGRTLWIAGSALATALCIGLVPRWNENQRVAAQTAELALNRVRLVHPAPPPPATPITLSGEIRPASEAAIYARVSGYVRKWHADLGSRVEPGQLLAELDTPDLDRQIAQARAELAQARAALQLAEATARRWSEMLKSRTVSLQEAEEKAGDAQLKKAALDAALSGLQRLEEVQRFARITAPFAGTIVERRLDIGQLVAAGTDQPLFRLAETSHVRIYVRVPQNLARAIAPGQGAEILVSELPGQSVPARVARAAGAMDPSSRTLLVELETENPDGKLLAGGYARVKLQDTPAESVLSLPANCLLFRSDGPQVVVRDARGLAGFRSVTLGRDFGTWVELLSGVSTSDAVVVSPPDSLAEGTPITPAADSDTAAGKTGG